MPEAILSRSWNEQATARGAAKVGGVGLAAVQREDVTAGERLTNGSFDAAMAAVVGAFGAGAAGSSDADARALATQRTVRGAGKLSGIKEETARDVKQAAAVDVAQIAADKLVNPASPGAVAEADAAELQESEAGHAGARGGNGRSGGRDAESSGHSLTTATVRGDRRGEVTDAPNEASVTKGASPVAAGASRGEAAAAGENTSEFAHARGANSVTAAKSAQTAAAAGASAGQVGVAANGSQANAGSAGNGASATVGVTQGTRATAFKKLLEQGQPARHATEQQQVAHSVAKGLQMLVKEGGGEVLLKLRPGELGAVSARLTIQDARVEATFRAKTELARDLLIKSVDDLRAALETRGLVVDRIDVRLDVPPEDAAARAQDQGDLRVKLAGSEQSREDGVGDAGQDGDSHGRDSQGSTDSRSEDDGRRGGMARMPMERAAAVADAPMLHQDVAGGIDGQVWTTAGAGGRTLDGFEWVA